MQKTVKVFIVEDEIVIVETLKAYFERENFTVEYADNGADAIYRFKKSNPDFVILDLMLPDISGEEICRELRRESDVPIMMLTAKTSEESRINGIEIGADDYIVKPFSPREVVTRVKGILRRMNKVHSGTTISFNNSELKIDEVKQEVIVRGEVISLTPIEFKIITTFAKSPGSVFSRLRLLESIQEDNFYEGYESGVNVHIKNLRKKIEKDSKNPKFILTVFGVGYKFGGQLDV